MKKKELECCLLQVILTAAQAVRSWLDQHRKNQEDASSVAMSLKVRRNLNFGFL